MDANCFKIENCALAFAYYFEVVLQKWTHLALRVGPCLKNGRPVPQKWTHFALRVKTGS